MGAFPRIYERRRPRDAVAFGLGAGILATSRLFEGFIFCIPLMARFCGGLCGAKLPQRASYAKRMLSRSLQFWFA